MERKVNRIVKVLLGHPREPLETGSREPFRDIFDCWDETFSDRLWGEHFSTGTRTDRKGIHEKCPR